MTTNLTRYYIQVVAECNEHPSWQFDATLASFSVICINYSFSVLSLVRFAFIEEANILKISLSCYYYSQNSTLIFISFILHRKTVLREPQVLHLSIPQYIAATCDSHHTSCKPVGSTYLLCLLQIKNNNLFFFDQLKTVSQLKTKHFYCSQWLMKEV